jgi:hypothetical protein
MVLAFPWNIGDTPDVDGLAYAMAEGANPWTPEARSLVLKRVLDLAGDMTFVAIDRQRALYRLTGPDADLLVWQNIAGWTDRPGHSVEIELPDWASAIEIWGWDGLRETKPARPGRLIVDGLNDNETYMIRVPRH